MWEWLDLLESGDAVMAGLLESGDVVMARSS